MSEVQLKVDGNKGFFYIDIDGLGVVAARRFVCRRNDRDRIFIHRPDKSF